MVWHEIVSCRLCGDRALSRVLDLGVQALSSRFPRPDEPDPPRVPLVLVRCDACGLAQMRHSVDTSELYTEAYGYRSGINRSMRTHLGSLAAEVAGLAGLRPGDVVVDIGCNDGTLLGAYPVAGLARVGVDPILEKFRDVLPPGVFAVPRYFSAEAILPALDGRRARAVTSIAMFYDLEDPHAFVVDIACILAPDGVWVLEQSYMPTMLACNAFDTVCHEHLEYYTFRQIDELTRRHGLRVFDVRLNEVNGGSMQVFVCHRSGPYPAREVSIGAVGAAEAELRLDTFEPFAAFEKRITALREETVAFVTQECARGRTFIAYGASTKGNTLLQYYGLDRRLIMAAAERNPEKYGRRTPATAIPIISEAEARARRPDYFLVLPWHFRDEFVEREAEFLRAGGHLVFPLPRLDVV